MGLDLSPAHCGVTVLERNGMPLVMTSIDKPLRGKPKTKSRAAIKVTEAQRIERNLNMANEIVSIAKAYNVNDVGIEDYAHSRVFRAHWVGETCGVVKSQLWLSMRIVATLVGIGSARKSATGFGRMTKEQVIEVVSAATEVYGRRPKNDHEADSYMIAWSRFCDIGRRKVKL